MNREFERDRLLFAGTNTWGEEMARAGDALASA
jgi:hypothetical protein